MERGTGNRDTSIAALHALPEVDVPRQIGLFLFSGFVLPEAAAVLEMFQSVNALAQSESVGGGRAHYEVTLISIAGGRIDSSSSVFVWMESVENRRYADEFHTLFEAGGAGARHALRDERLIRWLRRESSRSDAAVPIGDGRLLLDEAGVERVANGWAPTLGAVGDQQHAGEGGFAGAVTGSLRNALALIEQDFAVGLPVKQRGASCRLISRPASQRRSARISRAM